VIESDSDPEIDQELLVEAVRQISAGSPNAAINEALRRLVEEERGKRRAAFDRIQQLVADGALDFSKLDAVDE